MQGARFPDPSAWLARYVEDVKVRAATEGEAVRTERMPDGRTLLIARELAGGRGDVTVAGPRSRALFKESTGLVRAVVVRFRPGWAASLFGVPARTLTDRFVALDALWGDAGAALSAALLDARDTRGVLDRLARALAARSQPAFESRSARLARRAIRLLEAEPLRVDEVARRVGVTARHLRRAFTEHVGIGPKDFARTVRLKRAAAGATSSTDWSRVAAEAGYYDQAHLIGDFRDLVGLTPSAFARRAAAIPS